jgi:hypothetical protein
MSILKAAGIVLAAFLYPSLSLFVAAGFSLPWLRESATNNCKSDSRFFIRKYMSRLWQDYGDFHSLARGPAGKVAATGRIKTIPRLLNVILSEAEGSV